LTFTYDCGEFEKNMDIAAENADLKSFPQRRAESRKNGKLRGLGISNTIERASGAGTETAELVLDASGRVTLFAGSNSQGQGHETVFKQIVADRLGVDARFVDYVQGDTDRVRRGEGTGGSRSATMAGSACLVAVEQLVDKAEVVAAHLLQVDFESIHFSGGVFSSTNSNRTLTLTDVAAAANDLTLLPPGTEKNLKTSVTYQAATANYPNGCHICEVEIDIDTGACQIIRYSVVDDVGIVLNPLLLHGQIHGGVAQGAGQALIENIHFEDDGQLVTASFVDYGIARAHHLCAISVGSNPVPTNTNPLGAKGAGEAGCVGALPAVVNAIGNALSEFGVTRIPMPATPERIWRLINETVPTGRPLDA
jgi:carbon-monoxide dehydrogenase large subunit